MSQTAPTHILLSNSSGNPAVRTTWPVSLFAFLYSFLYAYVLQALPQVALLDRFAYLRYAESSNQTLFESLSGGILHTLANEPLWLLINIGLAQFLAPEDVVRAVIFAGAFTISCVVLRSNPRHVICLMVFLLTPIILKNYITHLRQGLAMAIFFAGYFAHRRALRLVLMTLAPFVHASFFFILPIVVLFNLLRGMRLASDVRLVAFAVYAIVTSIFLGVLVNFVGARQGSEYGFQMADVSGLGFLFWLGITGLMMTQGRRFMDEHGIALGVLLFYLISYFYIEVTARILESGLPIVLVAGLALIGWRRYAFVGAYLSFSVLQGTIRFLSPVPL